jgi:hypothetical protein
MTTLRTYNKRIAITNDAYFSVNIELENISCVMDFVWNNKTKRYHTSLSKKNGDVVFEGVAINAASFFPLNSLMAQNGLLGTFTLYPNNVSVAVSDETYRNWADYYTLVYELTLVV